MYSMQECCKLTGLKYDTLKYYWYKGLIPNVKRDKTNNYRVFDDDDNQKSWCHAMRGICDSK